MRILLIILVLIAPGAVFAASPIKPSAPELAVSQKPSAVKPHHAVLVRPARPTVKAPAATALAHVTHQAGGKSDQEGAKWTERDLLETKIAILKLQLQEAKLLNQVAAAGGTVDDQNGSSKNVAVHHRARHTHSHAEHAHVKVQQVAGVGGKMVATIETSDGNTLTVAEGSRIPGVGVVKSIQTDQVIVKDGGSEFSLPFASYRSGMYGYGGANRGGSMGGAYMQPYVRPTMPAPGPGAGMPLANPVGAPGRNLGPVGRVQ